MEYNERQTETEREREEGGERERKRGGEQQNRERWREEGAGIGEKVSERKGGETYTKEVRGGWVAVLRKQGRGTVGGSINKTRTGELMFHQDQIQ